MIETRSRACLPLFLSLAGLLRPRPAGERRPAAGGTSLPRSLDPTRARTKERGRTYALPPSLPPSCIASQALSSLPLPSLPPRSLSPPSPQPTGRGWWSGSFWVSEERLGRDCRISVKRPLGPGRRGAVRVDSADVGGHGAGGLTLRPTHRDGAGELSQLSGLAAKWAGPRSRRPPPASLYSEAGGVGGLRGAGHGGRARARGPVRGMI